MNYRARCPECRTGYAVPEESLGSTLRCSRCETVFAVPVLSPKADPDARRDSPDARESRPERGEKSRPGPGRGKTRRPREGHEPGKGGMSRGVLAGVVAGGVLLGVGLCVGLVFLLKGSDEKPAAAGPDLARTGATAPPTQAAGPTGPALPQGQLAPQNPPGQATPPAYPFSTPPATTLPPLQIPDTVEPLPVKAVAGQTFQCQLPGGQPGARFEVLSGPPELTVTISGDVTWQPPANFQGSKEFCVRVLSASGAVAHRYQVAVVPAPPQVTLRPRQPAAPPAPVLQPNQILAEKAVVGRRFTYQLPHNADQTAQLLRGPEGLTVSADGRIDWTPGPGPSREERVTVRFTPGHVALFRIAVRDDAASALALANPGGWAMAADGVTLIVSLPDQARLVYVDTVANKETRRVSVPFQPTALALQGQRLVAAARGAALVYLLDAPTGAVRKKIKVPEAAVAELTCHPRKGLVYGTTTNGRIVAINPATGTASATRARGMFIAMDPVKPDTLYAAVQPDIRDVLVIRELSRNRFALSARTKGESALLARFTVKGKQVRVAAVNPNAASNGRVLRVNRDGSRVAVVGGGGYVAPSGVGAARRAYAVPLFDTKDLAAPVGQVEVGPYPGDLAFHPALDLGVALQEAGNQTTLHVFDAQSLEKVRDIPLATTPIRGDTLPKANPGRLLTFGAKGTKILYYDASGPGALRSIGLDLTTEQKDALAKAYGK